MFHDVSMKPVGPFLQVKQTRRPNSLVEGRLLMAKKIGQGAAAG
jgi:hypothetical protein